MRLYLPFFVLLILVMTKPVFANEHNFKPIYFKNKTVNITLPINQERMVKLPYQAKLHLQPAIASKVEVVIQGDVLLLKAVSKFTAGRAKVVSREGNPSHPVILLSLSSDEQASKQSLELVVPSLVKQTSDAQETIKNSRKTTPFNRGVGPSEHPYKVLTRHAFQQAFSPERFIEPAPGVVRMNVFQGTIPLYEGGAFSIKVRESYRLGRYFATVFEIANEMSIGQQFDPRAIRGKWVGRAAFVYHLKAKGDPRSTTAVVMLSEVPFEDAVGKYLTLGVAHGQVN